MISKTQPNYLYNNIDEADVYVYNTVYSPAENIVLTQVALIMFSTFVDDNARSQIVADIVAASPEDRCAIATRVDDRIGYSVDRDASSFKSMGDREKEKETAQTTDDLPCGRAVVFDIVSRAAVMIYHIALK